MRQPWIAGLEVVTTKAGEYRRRAKACFDAAQATENEQRRAALLKLAEEWLRMAESWDALFPAATEQAEPTVRQQQAQAKNGDKKE